MARSKAPGPETELRAARREGVRRAAGEARSPSSGARGLLQTGRRRRKKAIAARLAELGHGTSLLHSEGQ